MYKLIDGEDIIKTNGTIAKRVVLLSSTAPASLNVTGDDVDLLNADDIIAAGSVLITPSKNYIAFEDGVFTEKE